METAVVEQRRDARSELALPVSVLLPEANRFSRPERQRQQGRRLHFRPDRPPPSGPGHEVEINFPRTTSLARQKGQYARIKSGKVLRVERKNMFEGANIGLAVQFV